MEKYRRIKIITIIALIVVIAGVSIGFAAFTSVFRVSSSAAVTPDASTFSVKFSTKQDSLDESEIFSSSKTEGLEVTNGIIDNSGAPTVTNLSAAFTSPGQYVEYTFYARNEGEYKAYLNNVNFVGQKKCTATDGATAALVQEACDDITMTVTVGNSSYTQTTAIVGHALERKTGEKVIVRLNYASDGALADGQFSVNFGKVTMVYSTIDDSSFVPPLSSSNPVLMSNLLSENAQSDAGVDFGTAPTTGVYLRSGTENDSNPIYYYRGAVTNNNAKFANFCWKIVRTTETGGVKLIYNGVPAADGSCNNTGASSQLSTSKFNTNYSTIDDVRYIYADGTDSAIKGVVDAWYASKMTSYTSMLEDIAWCNDRSPRVSGSNTYFGAYDRLTQTTVTPTLECGAEYQMSVASTELDKHLDYPVALLTADEITLAGSGNKGYSADAYLNTGSAWWSLSPSYFYSSYAVGFHLNSSGYLDGNYVVTDAYGVRPSVSLRPGTNVIGGDGSTSKPYIVG